MRKVARTAFILVVALLSIACSDDEELGRPIIEIVGPWGRVVPGGVGAMGGGGSGDSITAEFTIRNAGTMDLELLGTPLVDISGSSGFAVSRQPAESTIAPGESEAFAVTWTANAEPSGTAELAVRSTDLSASPYCFHVAAHGEPWIAAYGDGTSAGQSYSSVAVVDDGGLVAVGYTQIADPFDLQGLVSRVDAAGNVRCAKVVGGAGWDMLRGVVVRDGYVIAGQTKSYGEGGYDAWIMKFAASGTLLWQKVIGGASDEEVNDIIATDSGVLVVGTTKSFGAGDADAWVVEVSDSGTVGFQKTYGSADYDQARAVEAVSDGYIVVGSTTGATASDSQSLLFKIAVGGALDWSVQFGGSANDFAYDVVDCPGSGYLTASRSFSYGAGLMDVWLVNITSSGFVHWDVAIGGPSSEYVSQILPSRVGGYLVVGSSLSWGVGNHDVFLARISPAGSLAWARAYGTPGTDMGEALAETASGDIAVAGYIRIYEPDYYDEGLLMHLSSEGLPVRQVDELYAHLGYPVNPSESHRNASDGTVFSLTVADSTAVVNDTTAGATDVSLVTTELLP